MAKRQQKPHSKQVTNQKGFFDFFVLVDYYLQENRRNLYVYGAILVVLIAPILDYILLPQRMSITVISTHIFLVLLILSTLAWAGKFKNEDNKWSFKRIWHRLQFYFSNLKEVYLELKGRDNHQTLFIIGTFLIISGFIGKALQNVSEVIRRPIELFTDRPLKGIVFFEQATSLGFVFIIVGIIVLLYLNFVNKQDYNLFKIFIQKKMRPHAMQLTIDNSLTVIHSKNKLQISNLLASNPDPIFKKTINTLSLWSPKKMRLESEFEDHLYDFMMKKMRRSRLKIENQYIIKDEFEYGRVDLVIHDSIFIELKNNVNNKDLENATGQVLKYQRILEKSNVPVILLIVDENYEHVHNKLHTFITDYNKKHFQKLLGIVVVPK